MTPREILEQVKQRITHDPATYQQTSFCGTQCCIAGHIDVILNGAEFHDERLQRQSFESAIEEIEDIANAALGETESTWLFGTINCYEDENSPDEEQCPEYWPLDLSIEYETVNNRGKAAVGCKAIDRYLEERGL